MLVPVPPNQVLWSQERLVEFIRRGFLLGVEISPDRDIFKFKIENHYLGQEFLFYFHSKQDLLQWASGGTVRLKRVLRRSFNVLGCHEDAKLSESEPFVSDARKVLDGFGRLIDL